MDSVVNEPLLVQELKAGTVCRLIVAVFAYEKMDNPLNSTVKVIAGEHRLRVEGAYRASLVGRIHSLLESHGVDIVGIEQSAEHDSFALLIHATYLVQDDSSIGTLRSSLENKAKELGVTLRLQREELFAYMHRI